MVFAAVEAVSPIDVPSGLDGVPQKFEEVVNLTAPSVNPIVTEVTAEWNRLLHERNRRIKVVQDDLDAQDCRLEDD